MEGAKKKDSHIYTHTPRLGITWVNDKIRVECHTQNTGWHRKMRKKHKIWWKIHFSVSLNQIQIYQKHTHTHPCTYAHTHIHAWATVIRLICSSLSGWRLEWFRVLLLHTSLTRSLCSSYGFCIVWTSIFLCYYVLLSMRLSIFVVVSFAFVRLLLLKMLPHLLVFVQHIQISKHNRYHIDT